MSDEKIKAERNAKLEQSARKEQEESPEKFFLGPTGHIRDRIIIHESMEIPREGQFVSLNGYPFLIKPGAEVDVPRPVRLMLDTRVKTETIQGDDGKNYTRDIPRITYTLVKAGVNLDKDGKVIKPEAATKEW